MTEKVLSKELAERLDMPEEDVVGWYVDVKRGGEGIKTEYWSKERIESAYVIQQYPKVPTTDCEGAWKLLPSTVFGDRAYLLTLVNNSLSYVFDGTYFLTHGKDNYAIFPLKGSLLEAISSMLEWLLNNGYIEEKKTS